MNKLCASLIVMLCAVLAQAQPSPAPAGAGAGSGSNATGEKAGANEALKNGTTGARPWAEGVTDVERDSALKLFHAGNVDLNDGLFAKAADKYRDALKHWDHPAIHYNLALAEMNLDKTVEAYTDLQASLKFGDAPLQSKDKFDNAKGYMLALEKSIAEIEVSCDKAGAKVTIDGQLAFTAPGSYKAKVRAGKHTFVAEKEGYTTHINAPYISPGAPFRIDLRLFTAEELTRYHRKWEATWFPYAVIGGGALIGVVGGVLEMSASSSYKSYDDKIRACNAATGSNAGCTATKELTDLKHGGDTKRTLGFVGYGVAGAAFATGIALAIINRPQAYQIRAEDLESEKLTVAPIVAPGVAGAQLEGQF